MILKVFFIQGNGLAHVSYVDPTEFVFYRYRIILVASAKSYFRVAAL